MPLILQITDGLSTTSLLDLNGQDGSGRGVYPSKAPSLGRGQLVDSQQEIRWSAASGPAGLGRRAAEIPVHLVGSSADDVAARVANLMQLTRQPWWLRVRRHGATSDAWLQCHACVPDVETRVTQSGMSHIAVGTIACETEPYALGARVDQAAVAVTQDPAVAGGFWLDVNGVTGDTATPLLIRMNDGTAFGQAVTTFFSVRRRGTPSALTSAALTVQGETASLAGAANVTTGTVSDAALSGGSGARVTFGSGYVASGSGGAATLTFPAPSLSTDVAGLYRCFARVRRSSGAGTVVMRSYFGPSVIPPDDINSLHTVSGSEATQLVDLGIVQWPSAQPAGLASPLRAGATPTGCVMQLWRLNSGAATVDVDYLVWVPADEDGGWLQTQAAIPSAASRWVVLDGHGPSLAVMDASPTTAGAKIVGQGYAAAPKPTIQMRVPRVSKGDNRLFVVCGVSTANSLAKSNTLSVALSYWPRWTWLP